MIRTFIFTFFAALLLSAAHANSQSDSPNVLFILIDDLGWMDMGYNGSTFHETPHLDQFSKDAMRFDSAYTASPMCSPTRASIMTGKKSSPNRHHPISLWLVFKEISDDHSDQ